MFDYSERLSLYRINPIDWEKQEIYKNIPCDIQINEYKKQMIWQNSDNSEMADYFIFVQNWNNNIKVWDLIEFSNYFWEKETVVVISRDYIDYESCTPFIEILCKLKN